MTKLILFILAISNDVCAQAVPSEGAIEVRKPAIKESIVPTQNTEDLIISLYTEASQYKPQPIPISSIKIPREKTMQALYEEVAKKLTRDYEEVAQRLMKAFPSPDKVFEPLNCDDFFLYNKEQCVLNYIDVVVDRLVRRNDPYWGDKYIRLFIHLTESGKKKIGWISPFASVYINPFEVLKTR